ncbi:SGNH/GDSL hydrolase family protein [Nocardia stercoris]|uniref:SGNH/GDSL hydrolase family protein n=1 Tax=Nocardia stercoris TaxID=2483361 RepID=A0A3M2LCT1_9NOCA|nr:SGNH/GDSL hydrolase family protein [Nocardia stercoris]RMI35341.1 SGNH/GDSL hydrolase family protein [Nocardia stercoris]
MFDRFVALGDSLTEGVGDPDEARPNGVRGWADRVAAELAQGNPQLQYANLAIRGRKMKQVLAEQVPAAVELRPDLVVLSAGGNDILRPRVDLDELVRDCAEVVAQLAATGAFVVIFTAFDGSFDPIYKTLRGRAATYNEYLREIADRHHGAVLDFWRLKQFDDRRLWSWDRLHPSPLGHELLAAEVLRVLGAPATIEVPGLGPAPIKPATEQRRENIEWVTGFLLPWIGRRISGTSSGDGIDPKYPEYVLAHKLPDLVAAS